MGNNEGKCLDAILKVLMNRNGVRTYEIKERDQPGKRGIEMVCEVGGRDYAVEHTLIEPYPDQRKDGVDFLQVLGDDFESAVKDVLKPEYFYSLNVHAYSFSGKTRKELASIRRSLLAWVRQAIGELTLPKTQVIATINAVPPSVPIPATLACRRSSGLGGRLLTGRFAPELLEDMRVKRIAKALQDKGPKLCVAGRNGACTVLVLENNDIALTNEIVVFEAIKLATDSVTHLPDEIYMIDMSTSHVTVTQLRRDGVMCSVETYDPSATWTFKATSLVDI